MATTHSIFFQDSRNLEGIPSGSVDLMVTSPPYPMIKMWDTVFADFAEGVSKALEKKEGKKAFELMHNALDQVWDEVYRVLKKGGFACINIGDATRTIGNDFAVYPNHSRILQYLTGLGFSALPEIIWRKQTNAPNKFMGSGMLPAGAYVTLEHEYILILRKGEKREFKTLAEKQNRRKSAVFWEERNLFFSDIWFDIKGARQEMQDKAARKRSGAYPFEVVSRLINMYSVMGDTVLDPFLGTGTTMAAAMTAGRNSLGYEIDEHLGDAIMDIKKYIIDLSRDYSEERLKKHFLFVKDRIDSGKYLKHKNIPYGFPVITSQEKELLLPELTRVEQTGNHTFEATYSHQPQASFCMEWKETKKRSIPEVIVNHLSKHRKEGNQLELF